jgi:NAD(P)-dependent dehydrogenase (short-subunit alcohol dehydrogenase family)
MKQIDFTGKSAIVTGGTRGIGQATAAALLKLHCDVIITGTGDPPEWVRDYPLCRFLKLDFLDGESISQFLDAIIRLDKIDILINNAGIHEPCPVYDMQPENWQKILSVNLHGPLSILPAVTKKMKAAAQGKIANISSIAGIVSKPGSLAYSAGKSGLTGLSRALALDLAPWNILVNVICPGPTQTDMVQHLLSSEEVERIANRIPLKRLALPQEIADTALFLCSDLNTYITGQTIILDGGATIK